MRRFAFVGLFVMGFTGAVSAQSPAGKWAGYWVSDTNGHTGPLHARFRAIDDSTYRATFRGRFAGIVPFWYTTKLHVEGTGDGITLLGASQRLPLMGEYRTSATVTAANFDATYTSRKDAGRFVMTRRR